MNDAIELLKRVSTFSMLPDELLQSLAVNMKQRVCVNGELLFHSGDPGDSLFIIGSGQISVFLEISGRRLTLQEFGPGGAIGELALIDGNPRSASAMAIGETITWCLERETFRKALLEYPELVMVMLADLLVKLRFATSFIEEVVSWSRAVAEANYDDALEVIERAESEDMVRISGFLQAFSSMITEVKAREEAYQEEVNPQAPEKLDNFIREAQRIFTRLDGSMTSLIIGDKGSYFSVAFGAPVAASAPALMAARPAAPTASSVIR